MSALSERIAKANKENLSSREVVRRAGEFGLRVSHGTVANILKGSHGTPEDNTLRALGRVFNIPFTELRRLVGLDGIDEPWEPPIAASRMSSAQRRLVESLIHELVRPTGGILWHPQADGKEMIPLSPAEAAALLDIADGGLAEVTPQVAESLMSKGLASGTGKAISRKRPSPRS